MRARMSIVILGASGYLGAKIGKYLINQGFDVVLHARNTSVFDGFLANKDYRTLEAAVTNENFVDLIKKCEPQTIINCISLNHNVTGQDLNQTAEVNITPTLKILSKLASETTLKKFIYFSTQQVYGKIESSTVSEETPCKPGALYGLTHLLGENITSFYHRNTGCAAVSLRLSNGFGSPVFKHNDCWWLVVNDFCQAAIRDGRLVIKSDGTPLRDFIHIDDICAAVELLINTEKNKLNPVYNLGSGVTHSIAELAKLVAAVYQNKFNKAVAVVDAHGAPFNFDAVPQKPKYTYDTGLIKNLGFKCRRDIAAGIDELFDYLTLNTR